MHKLINEIESLISKATKAEKSDDAMRFSQAAVNAANALSQTGYVQATYGETAALDIDAMVNRFLGWPLPNNFSPDGGVYFEQFYNGGLAKREPTGTNLFTATQAKEMIQFLLGRS